MREKTLKRIHFKLGGHRIDEKGEWDGEFKQHFLEKNATRSHFWHRS